MAEGGFVDMGTPIITDVEVGESLGVGVWIVAIAVWVEYRMTSPTT
jgi:hypothetical protein